MGKFEDMKRAASGQPPAVKPPHLKDEKPKGKGKPKPKKKPRRRMNVEEIEALFAKKGTRLPHGSKFAIEWDATTQRWSGTLRVPRVVGGVETAEVFSNISGGAFRLLSKLDDLFRERQAQAIKDGTIPAKVQSGKDGVK